MKCYVLKNAKGEIAPVGRVYSTIKGAERGKKAWISRTLMCEYLEDDRDYGHYLAWCGDSDLLLDPPTDSEVQAVQYWYDRLDTEWQVAEATVA